ncbi:hypothetical protein KI387_021315 [Taxus chinensis]|uniref:BTB/POZ domain-containing protein n=1 Tax=Taxus chinensis TaxID=29808 RepID=A0AA38GA42_TAXCH|nr:hypothetical protein KI387_021315 [Taxus chinensis]
MAKEMLKFGDVSSSDIQLRLIASNGEEYAANPIHLYSEVVKKSKVLEYMISERWFSEDRPLKIEVITTVPGFENYAKCFGLMYSCVNGGRVCFSSVDECLAILQVAAHLLVDDCIKRSMEYLAAVRWTTREESQIRAVLSSLELQTFPDLTVRLDKLNCDNYLEMLEKSAKEMLSFIFQGNWFWARKQDERETICKYLKDKCDGNSSPEIADLCKRVFYEEYVANIECFKSPGSGESVRENAVSALRWLLEMFKGWDTNTYEAALKRFFEDEELAKNIASRATVQQREDAFKIFLGYLKAVANAKVITTRAFRLSLLQTWMPVVVDMITDSKLMESIEVEVIKVVETVPLSDQMSIYNVWTHAYTNNKKKGFSKIFNWWFEKLEKGYYKSKLVEESPVVFSKKI